MIDGRLLWHHDRPWVHVLNADATAPLSDCLPPAGTCVVARLDGRRMRNEYDLLENFSSNLEFPAYFGWNWSAFSECLRDMSWMPATRYLVVVSDAANLLAEEPAEFGTFARIMGEVGASWSHRIGLPETAGGKQIAFNTVLLDSADRLDAIADSLNQAGLDYDV